MRQLLVIWLGLMLVTLTPGCHGITEELIESKIDAFVNGILQCTELPGLNLAVVKDGEVYLTKGYGVKDLVTREPVTKETMFVIASVTKAFTATLMAKTIEEHRHEGFTWTTKVKDVLPDWFHLSDAYRTREVTVIDLIAHRSGLPRHDLPRTYGHSTEQLLKRMQYLNFTADFRTVYKYNNLMYGVASYVIERLGGGVSYEDQLTEKLLRPLGMSRTSFVALARDRWEKEFATTYIRDSTGELRKMSLDIPAAFYGTISSPGGIVSNAEDMAKWVQFNIKEGLLPDGTRLVDRGLMRNTHRPATTSTAQASLRRPRDGVQKSQQKIALGWREGHYRGYRLCSHTGNIAGWMSELSYLRDEKHGVFLNINGPYPAARDLIVSYVMDLLLGEEPWLDVQEACSRLNPSQSQPQPQLRDILKHGTQNDENVDKTLVKGRMLSTEDVQRFVGVYGHHGYGNVTVSLDDTSGRLLMTYGNQVTFDLAESAPDVFTATGREPFWYMTYSVRFESRTQPDVASHVTVSFEPELSPVFERGLRQDDAPDPPTLC